jgi:hypothetical protein
MPSVMPVATSSVVVTMCAVQAGWPRAILASQPIGAKATMPTTIAITISM